MPRLGSGGHAIAVESASVLDGGREGSGRGTSFRVRFAGINDAPEVSAGDAVAGLRVGNSTGNCC